MSLLASFFKKKLGWVQSKVQVSELRRFASRIGLVCGFLFVLIALNRFVDYFVGVDAFRTDYYIDNPLHRALSSSTSSNSTEVVESGHTAESLFGIITALDPVVLTVSFVIIVGAVLVVEFCFHVLHVVAFDTPFEHLIPHIEKELMIAGCTAFVFKIVVNSSGGLDQQWFECLEFADLLVPIFSFTYCGIGLVLVAVSVQQCDVWSKAYHIKLLELLDDFFDFRDSWAYTLGLSHFNITIAEMEFRIFHNIFCDSYKIQRKAFAFEEYVEKVFEKFVMEVIEIRPLDWIILSVLFIINLARYSTHMTFSSKVCETEDHHCKDEGLTQVFLLSGAILLIATILMALTTRKLELDIMRIKGISGVDSYYSFLTHMEGKKEKVEANVRMGMDQLRNAAQFAKDKNTNENYNATHVLKHRKAENLATRMQDNVEEFQIAQEEKENKAPPNVAAHPSFMRRMSLKVAMMNGKSAPLPDKILDLLAQSQNASPKKKTSHYGSFFGQHAPVIPVHPRSRDENDGHSTGKGSGSGDKMKPLAPEAAKPTITTIEAKKLVSDGTIAQPKPAVEGGSEHSYHLHLPSELNPNVLMSNIMQSVNHTGSAMLPPMHHHETPTVPSFVHNADALLAEAAESSKHQNPNLQHQKRDMSQLIVDNEDGTAGEELLSPSLFMEEGGSLLRDSITHSSQGARRPSSASGLQQGGGAGGKKSRPASGNKFTFDSNAIGEGAIVEGGAQVLNKSRSIVEEEGEDDDEDDNSDDVELVNGNDKAYLATLEDDEIAKVFFFRFPEMYFEAVQAMMMLISLYVALWLCNFVVAARIPYQKALSIAFGICSAGVYIYIIRSAALVRALYRLDNDAVLEVIEQTEGSRQLGIEMRDKILARLSDLGEPQAELYSLFREIDESGNGTLSRQEFAIFLNAIEINFSRKKWQQIFREIDLNYDDMVSFEEFFLFLFPEHDIGKALEQRRLKALGTRVRDKAKRYVEHRNKHNEASGKLKRSFLHPFGYASSTRVPAPQQGDVESGVTNAANAVPAAPSTR